MVKEYCFDGSRKLNLKEEPTSVPAELKARKLELQEKTEQNLLQAA